MKTVGGGLGCDMYTVWELNDFDKYMASNNNNWKKAAIHFGMGSIANLKDKISNLRKI
jgi:hypothetical protein